MHTPRLELFDTLKGVAIVMVCITHFRWEAQTRLDLLFPFWISMAVPIFMVVTGYLTTASWQRKGYRLRDLYRPRVLKPKLIQYLRPFTLMFAAELLLELVSKGRLPSPGQILADFLSGGIGKYGTYYVPVLLQMLLLFPLIYALLQRDRRLLPLCFLANLAYELVKEPLGISAHDYRLLAFRYIFLIAMGSALCLDRELRPGKYAGMLVPGVAYILLISYSGYRPRIFTRWNATSMMTAFYIVPILALLIKTRPQLHLPLFTALGRSSYHIFLAQILYYNYFARALPLETPLVRMAVGVALCLAAGVLFERLDHRLPSLRLPGSPARARKQPQPS